MDILTHDQIWKAIDALAARCGLSASGLARKAGLDPTTFNPSKRFTAEGRERWPSTESLAKILKCTGTSIDAFMGLIETPAFGGHAAEPENTNYREAMRRSTLPLIGFAKAGAGGYFDDAGFPVGHGWEEIEPPAPLKSEASYALKVSGDSMLPLYREGDVLIVDPAASLRRGDRVVARTRDGEVLAKVLERKTSKTVEFASLNPEHPNLKFEPDEIDWIARIVWASQ